MLLVISIEFVHYLNAWEYFRDVQAHLDDTGGRRGKNKGQEGCVISSQQGQRDSDNIVVLCMALHLQIPALPLYLSHCTMCCLYSIFTSQPNELRPTVKVVVWYIFEHIFVPARSIARWMHFLGFLWNQTLNLGDSPHFWCQITLEPGKKELIF